MILKSHLLIGIWRAVLSLPGGNELPFMMEVGESGTSTTITIINGGERINVDEYTIDGDSLFVKMPVFDSEIRAQLRTGTMHGFFYNHSRTNKNIIPFHAVYNKYDRFDIKTKKAPEWLAGRWQTTFSSGTADETSAIAVFEQNGNRLSGTFLTTTGDYRFLDGVVDGDSLKLSCFDGSHAFLFIGHFDGKKIAGTFYSGMHWAEPWFATRNDTIELPDAYALTFLKPGYNKFEFEFPDTEGKKIRFDDPYFENKVTIVQVMGSWCPNCMDETQYLAGLYNRLNHDKIAIVGLAFERSAEFKTNATNIARLRQRFGINYPVLIAGKAAKDEASKALPMLSKVMGYPTTIIIDKKGQVRKIHTGFNGPATGKYFEAFKTEFEELLQTLMAEQ